MRATGLTLLALALVSIGGCSAYRQEAPPAAPATEVIGCCVGDGICLATSRDRCDGYRVPACLGDGDGDLEDDACRVPPRRPRPGVPDPEGCVGVHPLTPEPALGWAEAADEWSACKSAEPDCEKNLRALPPPACAKHCKLHERSCARPGGEVKCANDETVIAGLIRFRTTFTMPQEGRWRCEVECEAEPWLCRCACVAEM